MTTFVGVSSISEEQLERNEQHTLSLNLPMIGEYKAKGPLAIVGGGPSVTNYTYTLKSWPGTVWAVNGSWKWCKDNGIDAVFFSFDSNPSVARLAEGATKAILGSRIDPSVLQKFDTASVWIGEGNEGGTTSVGASVIMGVECGFQSLTLFGCEANHQPGASHVHTHFEPDFEMVVWVDGMHFYTTPQLYIGCVELAQMIKECPLLKERCGGMLRAMVETKETPKIVGCSPNLYDKLFVA